MFLCEWDAGQQQRAPGALVCNDVYRSPVDFLLFIGGVELLFSRETASAFASVPSSVDVISKNLVGRYHSPFW